MPKGNIQDVLKRHTEELMAVSGVVGVAEGKSHGRPCIRVFVVDKDSESLKHLPQNIEGYLLKLEGTSKFQARSN